MHSSSGYGTNTPPPNCGDLSNSNQSSQYSSNEKLLQKNQQPNSGQKIQHHHNQQQQQQQHHQLQQQQSFNADQDQKQFLEPRVSLCGNLNCQNCSNQVGYNHLDCLSSKINEATNNYLLMDRRSRLSSSNDSSQLDDSSEAGYSSPISFQRQRARSLR